LMMCCAMIGIVMRIDYESRQNLENSDNSGGDHE